MSAIGKRVNSVITSKLAPFLRSKGFQRKGRTFHRIDGDRIDVVNFQGSKWNSGNSGQIAVNLGVFFRSVAELVDPFAPEGLPGEESCTVRQRLGALIYDGRDYWWRIDKDTDESALSQELVVGLERTGLPWLESMSNLDAVKDEVPAFVAAGVCLSQGQSNEARVYLRRSYDEAPLAANSARAWGIQHGLEEA